MTAGQTPPNPSELLSSERMKTLLNAKNGWFDWMVVDAPPVLAVTDAVLHGAPDVGRGLRRPVGNDAAASRQARAPDTLMTGKPRLLGVVLNGVDLERNKYYYSRYYGYEHTHYYSATPAS